VSQPISLEVSDCRRACPQCGYENGFHVSFRRLHPDEGLNDIAICLICPSCSALYDLGLRTRLAPVPRPSPRAPERP